MDADEPQRGDETSLRDTPFRLLPYEDLVPAAQQRRTRRRRRLLVNKAPVLEVEGGTTRRAKTGRPLTLTARTSDDSLLTPAALPPTDPARPGRVTKNAARGLRLAWFVYRGAGQVTFEPEQFRAWEDTREGLGLAVGARLDGSATPTGRQMGSSGDVQQARHLRPEVPGTRRRAHGRRRM